MAHHAARHFCVDIEGKEPHEIKWPSKQVECWSTPQQIGILTLETPFMLGYTTLLQPCVSAHYLFYCSAKAR